MNKTILLFCIASCQVFSLFAIDTLKVYSIDEVSLTRPLSDFYAEDRRKIVIDSSLLGINKFRNIGYMLSCSPQLNIRQYGAEGSISMISVHGLRANHTQVNWNGFPVNSMSTGDVDLSLIPVGFIDQVSLVMGAPGSLYGSGTFGGVVEIANIADFHKRFSSTFSYENGSFGSNKFLYSLKTGNRQIQYNLCLNQVTADNNFTYRDYYLYGSPEVEIKNNTYSNKGIMQNLHIRVTPNSQIDAGWWIQSKFKEIPDIMGKFYQSYSIQQDKTNKALLSYSRVFKKSSLKLKNAFFSDYLHYQYKTLESNENFDIDDSYNIKRNITQFDYRYYFSDRLIIDAMTVLQYAFADISNYGGKADEKRISMISAAKYKFEKAVLNFSVREELVDKRSPQLLLSGGFYYPFVSWLSLKSSLSNKYRTPTFNERFWRPGGNPDLLPEKGLTGEILFENSWHNFFHVLEISNVFFYTKIKDLIQWATLNGVLQPIPEKEVGSKGYEFNAKYTYQSNSNIISLSSNYAFTHSVFTDHYTRESYIGNILIYSPLHTANGLVDYTCKLFQTGLILNYTGKRYTTEDNSELQSIPAYLLLNLYAGYSFKLSGFESNLQFRIDNLLNTSYEIIKAYAMPGRAYYISLSIGFTNSK